MLLRYLAFEHLCALSFADRDLTLEQDEELVSDLTLCHNHFIRLEDYKTHRSAQILQLLRVPELTEELVFLRQKESSS